MKGKAFSFTNRDYLLQPYRDNYRDIIFYKGRQVEMTEFSMNWLMYKLFKHPYTAGLHTFPRDNQCLKFSKQRLDPAIRDSDFIGEWYAERESELKMRKFIDNSDSKAKLKPYNFYILGGTWEARKDSVGDAARGISIDFLVYDERQDHPDDVETVVGEAASHSDFKQTLTLGTPKLPGTQFDMEWESSDKHFWYVKCEHCGRLEPITMDNILDSGDEEIGYFYGCPRCKQPINRNNGIWMATNPMKRPPYRGYHINQLMVCWITANDIMAKYRSTTYPKRRFFNEVLGFAYGGDDVPITLPMMYKCADNSIKLGTVEGSIYAGIDWGSTSYMILEHKGNQSHRMVDCFMCDSSDPREHPEKFAKMLKRYAPHVKRVVCDAGPDITRYYNLRDALIKEGVTKDVWACYYATPPAKTAVSWNDKEHFVTVGRSEIIEMVIDEVSEANFIIPGADKSQEKVETLMDHFTNIAAERAKTASGMEYITYVNTGPDHFLHAKVYADIASYNGVAIPLSGALPARSTQREIAIVSTEQPGKLIKPHSRMNSIFPVFGRRRR